MTPAPCQKIPYATRRQAKVAADRAPGQKVYQCSKCGYWHMTSRTNTELKRARKKGGYH